MSSIYSFNNNSINDKSFISIDIQKQVNLLNECSYFHGEIDRNTAESRIGYNGEFLVRLSTSDNNDKIVISTKWNGAFLHVIVKTDINNSKMCLVYYLDKKYIFENIVDLIKFHKDNQQPLSDESGSVLYRPVDKNRFNGFTFDGKPPRYRKSSNYKRSNKLSTFTRCGSETELSQRFEENFTPINKSMTDLTKRSTESLQLQPNKPEKPTFKVLNSKHLLAKIRPKFIKVRNAKLYNPPGDYSDYNQLKDNESALQRESIRRGLSTYSENTQSPSLMGFNHSQSAYNSQRNSINQFESTYVVPSFKNVTDSRISMVGNNEDFNLYGIGGNSNENIDPILPELVAVNIGLKEFIDFRLVQHKSCWITVKQSEINISSINKAGSFLISNNEYQLVFCKHLIDELTNIFFVASYQQSVFRLGYRSVFLDSSWCFIEHLKIRQACLTQFVEATILCCDQFDRKIQLILFWVKVAEHLHTHIKDMFHFRAVVNAIYSDKLSKQKLWRHVYKVDHHSKSQLEQLRRNLKDGSLLTTDLSRFVPDIVELVQNQFHGDRNSEATLDSLDSMWTVINNGPMAWSPQLQLFDSDESWLVKISTEMQCFPTISAISDLVKTETILALLYGNKNLSLEEMPELTNTLDKYLTQYTNKSQSLTRG